MYLILIHQEDIILYFRYRNINHKFHMPLMKKTYNLSWHQQLPSTQTYLEKNPAENQIIIAERQTAGRGRKDEWLNVMGSLMFSFQIDPKNLFEEQFNEIHNKFDLETEPEKITGNQSDEIRDNLNPRTGTDFYTKLPHLNLLNKVSIHDRHSSLLYLRVLSAMKKTLKTYNIETFIKWPNDILVKVNRLFVKIAGVIIDNIFTGNEIRTIVGIGINLGYLLSFEKKKQIVVEYEIFKEQLMKENTILQQNLQSHSKEKSQWGSKMNARGEVKENLEKGSNVNHMSNLQKNENGHIKENQKRNLEENFEVGKKVKPQNGNQEVKEVASQKNFKVAIKENFKGGTKMDSYGRSEWQTLEGSEHSCRNLEHDSNHNSNPLIQTETEKSTKYDTSLRCSTNSHSKDQQYEKELRKENTSTFQYRVTPDKPLFCSIYSATLKMIHPTKFLELFFNYFHFDKDICPYDLPDRIKMDGRMYKVMDKYLFIIDIDGESALIDIMDWKYDWQKGEITRI